MGPGCKATLLCWVRSSPPSAIALSWHSSHSRGAAAGRRCAGGIVSAEFQQNNNPGRNRLAMAATVLATLALARPLTADWSTVVFDTPTPEPWASLSRFLASVSASRQHHGFLFDVQRRRSRKPLRNL